MTILNTVRLCKVCDKITQERRLHTRVAFGPYLFFITQERNARALGHFGFNRSHHTGICADFIVMTVRADKTSVEADISRLECGYKIKLRRKKIRFRDTVLLKENTQDIKLYLLGFFIAVKRAAAYKHIQILARKSL